MPGALDTIRQFKTAVVADYDQIRKNRAKYRGERISSLSLPIDVVQKVGLQMMTAVRVMQALERARVPFLPQVVSRAIRHLYGAEIHWRAKIEPGISLVHGCGLVISHAATVGTGCILFQNVTLGESVDAETRQVGSPTLGRDVHVGPGATLLGPISVGDRTKIMAGCVLTRSVPPDSLVRPADIVVVPRLPGGGRAPSRDVDGGERASADADQALEAPR